MMFIIAETICFSLAICEYMLFGINWSLAYCMCFCATCFVVAETSPLMQYLLSFLYLFVFLIFCFIP